MAGNKDNTTFKLHKPHIYELRYLDHHGEESTFRGNSKQVINYILNQQL
jgi:hypothetical protein